VTRFHFVDYTQLFNVFFSVSQNNELVYSPVLRRFLLGAQQKTAENCVGQEELTVYLLNGTQVQVKVSYEDSSENVLQVRHTIH
jgi:hypothetical protein